MIIFKQRYVFKAKTKTQNALKMLHIYLVRLFVTTKVGTKIKFKSYKLAIFVY
ncbi:hypothetical protein SAMN05444355_104142 [Flavobacterium frigoris]|uniref:Uncharacterized protein n=1 Tax=Flavobacterium frigoris TaxID=229204 RepID=A0A1H9IXG0_FLAFI|nr:hypothetical protein SAMN05444355_104142 [Flavobacterium frigoris]